MQDPPKKGNTISRIDRLITEAYEAEGIKVIRLDDFDMSSDEEDSKPKKREPSASAGTPKKKERNASAGTPNKKERTISPTIQRRREAFAGTRFKILCLDDLSSDEEDSKPKKREKKPETTLTYIFPFLRF